MGDGLADHLGDAALLGRFILRTRQVVVNGCGGLVVTARLKPRFFNTTVDRSVQADYMYYNFARFTKRCELPRRWKLA